MQPFHAFPWDTKVAAEKKCQLLFRKRFPSLAGRTEVMMVSAERLS